MWKATSKNSLENTVISPLDISGMTQNSYPLKTTVPPAHWMCLCFYLRGHLIFPCSLRENDREKIPPQAFASSCEHHGCMFLI